MAESHTVQNFSLKFAFPFEIWSRSSDMYHRPEFWNLCFSSAQMKDASDDENDASSRKSFDDQPEEDKEKIRKLVYILDKFSVSVEGYHELTMLEGNEEMTKSYMVKSCQNTLNKGFDISATPGPHPGAEMSFKELLKKELASQEILSDNAKVINNVVSPDKAIQGKNCKLMLSA